jgi:hypothetical protein
MDEIEPDNICQAGSAEGAGSNEANQATPNVRADSEHKAVRNKTASIKLELTGHKDEHQDLLYSYLTLRQAQL